MNSTAEAEWRTASRPARRASRHQVKLVRTGPALTLGETVLKWYEIAPPEEPVAAETRALARQALADAVTIGELELGDELGFVILHRCRDGFHFLLVSTWRNDNELWETVWAKDGDDDPAFRPWSVEGSHRPTFCVWELGVVGHERLAWSRFLFSPRDRVARETYAVDTFEGVV